jgi:hypothetical protein
MKELYPGAEQTETFTHYRQCMSKLAAWHIIPAGTPAEYVTGPVENRASRSGDRS